MKIMGLEAIYKRPNTSKKHPENRIYPYLLRNMQISRANQVWCADISYIPVKRGFLYLVAIMDWATRKVLSWRLSNSAELFAIGSRTMARGCELLQGSTG
jgi:putative transposase